MDQHKYVTQAIGIYQRQQYNEHGTPKRTNKWPWNKTKRPSESLWNTTTYIKMSIEHYLPCSVR